ncbi:M20/M25/M40 family metallo-hydrolase [Jidongwangia harbinensis]|uniref:M20/M25/M40 family metallo-hydrolase n=1 Tax=Jidongwangia harbinensis TaxID=2878561 RepID=UPI001CD95E40|nr:M20/M25/M40 family metallo-hydrolase [Jidongwangia harbinensis]MCA2213904.1 M20/M25/M40 family metallo-hydrolase [Jidongwangia harbinensis]
MFRTIRGDPAELGRCANWLSRQLRDIGLTTLNVPGPGPPPVVARSPWRHGRPHVLLYGHYDVQPAPPAGWHTPPFRAVRRGGELRGRGVSDNKGPIVAHLAAIAALREAEGRLPVNLTVLLDGEEEVGSPHLPATLARHARLLAGRGIDVVVVSDTRMLGPHRPALVYALRGSVTAEVCVAGAGRPLHVGAYAGLAPNPARELAVLLAGLPPPGPDVARPAISVIRMAAGDLAMAIPARATAVVNVRTVPGQNAAGVVAALRRHAGGRARVRLLSAADPVRLPRRNPAMAAAAYACERGFGRAPELVRSGGTIPAVAHLRRAFGTPVVLLGFGLPDDHAHGPDERLDLDVFDRAVETCLWLLPSLGHALQPSRSSDEDPWPGPGRPA